MNIRFLLIVTSTIFLTACQQAEAPVETGMSTDSGAGTAPQSTATDAELLDTYWKVIEIDGEEIVLAEEQREPHLILDSAESRAHGLAGCNNFFGTFETDGETISFSPIGVTRMACERGMDIEQAFLHVLAVANRVQVSGQVMNLYDGDQLLARFEAAPR